MNKKLICALAATLFVGGMTAATQASVLVSDSFSYADGDLVGNTPNVINGGVGGGAGIGGTWNAHSSQTSTATLNVSNQAAIINEVSGVQDDNIPFANGFAAGTGTILTSQFDMSVADPGAAVVSQYFAMFLNGSSNFGSRVWVTTATDPTDIGHYRLAMTNKNKLPAVSGSAVYSGDLSFGTTYTVGSTYDYDTASGEFWVSPAGQTIDFTTGGMAPTDGAYSSDPMSAYAFRQSSGNTIITVDNLVVGTVPEPASLGIIAAAGLLALRRRRIQSI